MMKSNVALPSLNSVMRLFFTAKTASGAGYEQVYDIDEIIVRMPTPEEIERLDIPPGTPVAEHIRTGYTRTDVAVRVMISIIPGDTMIFEYKIPT